MESSIEIIEYEPRYAGYFRDFNYEWLEEYFEVEPYDRIVLNDPQKQIIRLGGYVFFARWGGDIAGTCALIRHTDYKYELAKLAVTRSFRRHGVGRRLVGAAIDKARSLDAKTLVLTTSEVLTNANRLYQDMGFEFTDLAEIGPLPYKRKTVAMKMEL